MRHDPSHWSRRRVLGLGAAVAVAAGCGLDRQSSPDRPKSDAWAGTLLDPPFEKPDVTFTDLDGDPFPFREATEGRLSVLFFGFTQCPDVCPVYLQTMARSIEAIGSGPGSQPQVLFVGVDVARDTPDAMRRYLGNIDPSFVGLTGAESAIADAVKALRMPPVVIGEPAADGSYDVGHPSQVTVFTKDDLAHRIYPSDTRQQEWARDLPRLDRGVWS